MSIINTPGRMSTAQKQLLFKAMLPPLGFNTYYFQIKSKCIVLFSRADLFISITFVIGEERVKSKVKVTYNEQCTLQNQVCYTYNTYKNKYDLLFI
jgi:hypothetical protein